MFSRRLAEAEARIAELESSLALLSVDRPPSLQSAASSGEDVRYLSTPITPPGPRVIPLPSASGTVSPAEDDTDSDSSSITIPDSDDDDPPAAPPPPSTPSPPPSPNLLAPVRRQYLYSSPTVPATVTTEWSQAARHTQGVQNGQVRLVAQQSGPRKKPVCWAVFRGRNLGVFNTWALAEAAVIGFRLAVFQGYANVVAAHHAFDYAVAHGYTSTTPQARGLPLPLAEIPASIVDASHAIVDEARLLPRASDDRWYIVYQGVNPGVYATYLEAALNTNGIRLSSHDSRETLSAAIAAFQVAQDRGDVQVRREAKY
ncbi:hypothetical protein C8F01DRAFT_1264297 [Mycena amicta]|nr:hypothetical protein C8F01DRAFT_1264297 [Mycena amicta]